MFLANLGFDKEELRKQKPFEPNPIKTPIDLSKFISNSKNFFIYYGQEAAPPCEKSTVYMILTDVMKVSKKQLEKPKGLRLFQEGQPHQ